MPVLSYNIIFRTSDLEDEHFQDRYKTIINDMRTDNPLRFQFICVFYFRRAVYASVFVFLSAFPLVQVTASIGTVIGMLAYLIIIRPYQSTLSKFLSITNDVLLLACLLLTLRFLDVVISPSVRLAFGQILITMILATISINWVSIIISGVFAGVQKIRSKKVAEKRKEKQVRQEERL